MSTRKAPHFSDRCTRSSRKRDIAGFAADLEKAVKLARPTRDGNYKRTTVFSFRWSNDDLDSKASEQKLLEVFKRQYNFEIITHVIDSSLASSDFERLSSLNRAVLNIVDNYTSDNCLTIYLYSGHGAMSDELASHYMIAGLAHPDGKLKGPQLDWMLMHTLIKSNQAGEALYIFDSCFAGVLAVGSGPEVLASSTWSTLAGADKETSFSAILTNHLQVLNGTPISVAKLFANIHRDSAENKIEYPPFYVPHPNRPSIILQKLETKQPMVPETRQQKANREAYHSASNSHNDRVLISVKLLSSEGVASDINGWKRWLTTNLPNSVDPAQINIEAAFDSHSSVILVSMPLDLWAVIPESAPAYGFVCHVSSRNKLLPQYLPLAERGVPTGRENQKPGHDRSQSLGDRGASNKGSGGRGNGRGGVGGRPADGF